MERDFKNKIVVVTGGAEGLGYQIVNHFLQADIQLGIILDINEKKGSEAADLFNSKYGRNKAIFMKCDVTKDLETVSSTIFDTYGYVDILVNNAGIVDETSARRTLETNTLAVVEWSVKFWERMRLDKGGKGGTIVNIASGYGYKVDPFVLYYKASKFAVVGFSRCLGHEYNFKTSGVRVLTLCPDFTTTSLLNNKPWEHQVEDYAKFMKSQVHQKPEDVGKAAVKIYKKGESGSVWSINAGQLTEIFLS